MPNFSQWDRVQDQIIVVPEGPYVTMCEAMDPQVSQSGKLMYNGGFRIEAPEGHAGELLTERFVVGTDDDPGAEDPETWMNPRNVAAKRLKGLFLAAKLDMSRNVDQLVRDVVRKRVQVLVGIETEPALDKQGQPNRWAGQQRNNIAKFYAMGEPVPPRRTSTAVPPAPVPVATARVAASPPLAGRTNARPAPRPAAIVPQPVPVVAPPPVPAAPAVKTRREVMLLCSLCEATVPKSQWAAHEAAHQQGGETEDVQE